MSDELEYETDLSREEIADYLESFAADLRGEGPFSVLVGEDRVMVDPPRTLEFEVELEDESSMMGSDERSIEFELEWDKTDGDEDL